MPKVEHWTLRPDGTYDGPMAGYELVVREASYVGASAGQAAYKDEVESLRQQLAGAVDRGHALYEAMREITHVGFRSREDMWAFAQEAIDAYTAHGGQ